MEDRLHEQECVELSPGSPRRMAELLAACRNAGLSVTDDFVHMPRSGRFPIWQSDSIVEVAVLKAGEEVFDLSPETEWDCIRLDYLLATLPADTASDFVGAAAAISDVLGLPLRHRGREVDSTTLMALLRESIEDLRRSFGEPGSSEVAEIIESTYPR